MKKYLLFAGDNYYPAGGWEDFRTEITSLDSLEALDNCDWYQLVDEATKRIVRKGYKPSRAPHALWTHFDVLPDGKLEEVKP